MISNNVIVRFAEVIFTNTDRDVRRGLPMAGRRQERKAFLDVAARGGRQVVTISAPLGAGKTFFLNAMRGELIRTIDFDEDRNAHTVYGSSGGATAEQLQVQFADADPRHRCILILEELDRKGEYATLIAALERALSWVRVSHDGLLVLTGDRFLEHPAVTERILDTGIAVTPIELEPLDRDLMTDAIALRLAGTVPHADLYTLDEAREAAELVLAEPPVAHAVLPPTEPTTANFREAFGLLKLVSSNLLRREDCVSFPSDIINIRVNAPRLAAEPRRIEEHVLSTIKQAIEAGECVRALSDEELRAISESRHLGADFVRKVSNSLVTSQILDPGGIPYLYGGVAAPVMKYLGPFLPRQNTFIRVLQGLQES